MSELDQELRGALAALAHAEPSELDERTRARIRNAVHARAERRVLWPWLAFAVLGTTLVLCMTRVEPARLPVAHELPSDAARDPHVASAPAQTCAAVENARLVTEPSGRRRLALARALLVADRDADVRVTALTSCLLELSLTEGKLAVHARELAGGRLIVRTPHGAVHVRGTVFGVEVSREALEVPLIEGKVELERGDRSYELEAGQALRLGESSTRQHAVSALQRAGVLSWLGLQTVRPQPPAPPSLPVVQEHKVWREGTPFTLPGPELPSSIQPDGRPMKKPPVTSGDKP
jgi:ferric-dicitrate binding protein FerR (iron transport regulator)